MATNIPPHNLGELAAAIRYLIDHYDELDEVTVDDLMQFVHGPGLPHRRDDHRAWKASSPAYGTGTRARSWCAAWRTSRR